MVHSLLDWSIRASLIVLGVATIAGGLRLRSATALHRVWTAALVAMLLLPVWTAWGPKASAPILPMVREARVMKFAPELADPSLPAVSSASSSFGTQEFEQAPAIWNWERALRGVYAAGALLMLARLLRGTWNVRSMIGAAHRAEGFLVSPLCSAPVVAGWFRPVLLLPEGWRDWSAAKLGSVLVHERQHIRRRDPLVQWLALLNRCVFWFHPLAWWLELKLAALAEDASDDAVLANGLSAADYAGYLIEIARSVGGAGTGTIGGSAALCKRKTLAAHPADYGGRAGATAVPGESGGCGWLVFADDWRVPGVQTEPPCHNSGIEEPTRAVRHGCAATAMGQPAGHCDLEDGAEPNAAWGKPIDGCGEGQPECV